MKDKKKFSNTPKPSLSIVGCGWLGLPLATRMAASGYLVRGSTTREEKLETLSNAGIEPFIFDSSTKSNANFALFQTDTLIINVPPGRRNPDLLRDYPTFISSMVGILKTTGLPSRIIFVSSTSVYPEDMELVDEETPERPSSESGLAILAAERIIKNSGKPWTILRCGGLVGPGRHPGRFFAGKTGLPHGDQVINFLQLEDAMGILRFFIENPSAGGIYNAVSPVHPSKREFYPSMARNIGLPEPIFEIDHHGMRREISSAKLIRDTGYKFIYPDPMKYTF